MLATVLSIDVRVIYWMHGSSGLVYQKFGVVEDYWEETHSQIKVPTLRNVGMTPPYFHDGSVATLPEAVRVMGKVQLGRDLSKQDVDAIAAFLGSLTGRLPKDFETVPELPAAAFLPNTE